VTHLKDLSEAKNFLFGIRLKWYDLGLELKVKEEELDVIKHKEKDDPNACLREMLRIPLKSGLTWTRLAIALFSEAINEYELAKEGMPHTMDQ
jgi:hypothetical protein